MFILNKIRFKSIRSRLSSWFLILALLPLLIGILITYKQQTDSTKKEIFSKLTAIRDLKVQQLHSWLDEKESFLKSVAEDKEFRDLEQFFQKEKFNESDDRILENMHRILKRHLINFDDFLELSIINSYSKEVIVSTNSKNRGMNVSHDPSIAEFLKTTDFYIKDIHQSKFYSEPAMACAMPIRCSLHNGKYIIGVLVARINLKNSLYPLLNNRVGLGKSGETLIVNKDLIALNELRWHENAPLKFKIKAESAVKAAGGETGIIVGTDYRGEQILAAYTYLPRTKWGFVAKQDLHELNSPIRILIENYFILFFVSAILIALIVFMLSKQISKPIIDMSIVTQKIKDGNYDIRNKVRCEDELGFLAESINEMAATLQSILNIQEGVVAISNNMIDKTSIQKFGSELLATLMEITQANMSTFYLLNEKNLEFEHFVSIGANKKLLKSFSLEHLEGEFGNAISKKKICYLQDIPESTVFKFVTIAGEMLPKEIITLPLLVDDKVVAVISFVSIKKLSRESYPILEQSWNAINSSYSRLLADEKVRVMAANLLESNQHLEAQTDELQEQAEVLQSQTEELSQQSEELQVQNIELETQKKQLENANRLKSEFLSNMSHELRTPLNSIIALSRVLTMQAQQKLTKEENRYLEIVERNGKRLLSLINDILDLSKIEAGKIEVNPKLILVSIMLNNIRESLLPIITKKNLEFKLNIAKNLPKIETDENRLHQVLLNIINNSVKFTNRGKVEIIVSFDCEKINIIIKDTGIGIPQEDLPHIFEEFRQVDGSSSRQYEGTGLGLAIVRKMLKILGGEVEVVSDIGKGTVFTIILPLKWRGEIEQVETQTIEPVISQMAEKTILVVEDSEVPVILVKAILKNRGCKLDVVSSGQQALAYVKDTIPDGIILDLMMPEMDGFEVLEKMRNTAVTKNIPVLILTAKDLTKEDLSRLSANNVQQLVQKGDVDINEFLSKIELMLSSGEKEKQININNLLEEQPVFKKQKVEKNVKSDTKKVSLARVLVVEDNPDNMTTIKAIIGDRYFILEASDGRSALDMAMSKLPDIILLDISLPKMDGIEVLKILKQNKETANIPVIAVTAHAMKEDKEKFLAAGFNAYVTKPIEQEILLKTIEKWLKK